MVFSKSEAVSSANDPMCYYSQKLLSINIKEYFKNKKDLKGKKSKELEIKIYLMLRLKIMIKSHLLYVQKMKNF